jgi:superfamily II DNA helicase RecQ
MRIKIINIRVPDSSLGEEELNRFLATHKVVSVDKTCVQFGQNACWSFVISYLSEQKSDDSNKRSAVDYKEVLNDEDFSRFAQLRDLRNRLAKEEGKPAYAIFTNEQLAKLVTDRVTSKETMAAIAGIGESRIAHYADRFLPLLQKLLASNAE